MKHSEARRLAVSEGQKRAWQNPEVRNAHSVAGKRAWAWLTPKQKQARIEAMKRGHQRGRDRV